MYGPSHWREGQSRLACALLGSIFCLASDSCLFMSGMSPPSLLLMSASTPQDLSALIQAMTSSVASDNAQNLLTASQWELLAPYLVPVNLSSSEILFAEGTLDRNLYMVEAGSLSVHYQDSKERIRLALVGPGSLVGEGAFFAHRPRRATVQAAAPSRLWCLTALRYSELANRQPALALALVTMAGQVLARRASDSRRRVAST